MRKLIIILSSIIMNRTNANIKDEGLEKYINTYYKDVENLTLNIKQENLQNNLIEINLESIWEESICRFVTIKRTKHLNTIFITPTDFLKISKESTLKNYQINIIKENSVFKFFLQNFLEIYRFIIKTLIAFTIFTFIIPTIIYSCTMAIDSNIMQSDFLHSIKQYFTANNTRNNYYQTNVHSFMQPLITYYYQRN